MKNLDVFSLDFHPIPIKISVIVLKLFLILLIKMHIPLTVESSNDFMILKI